MIAAVDGKLGFRVRLVGPAAAPAWRLRPSCERRPARSGPPPLPPSSPPPLGAPGGTPGRAQRAKLLAFALSLLAVAGIGVMDYFAAEQLDFFLLYVVPIAVAGWSTSWVGGYAIAAAATAAWLGSDLLSPHEALFWTYRPWNAILQLASFLIVAYSAARIRADFEEQKRLAEQLKGALNQVKQLKGLLPICAWCKRVRDDQGYWHQVEAYVSDHTDAVFSHGMCPECQEKAFEEVEERRKAPPSKARRSHARGPLGEDVSR